jgi:tryptophan synthase alpha chain
MGYLNPILQFGFEEFCSECAQSGVDGLILPDIPAHVFEKEYQAIVNKYDLDFIFLVTPETSEVRMKKLDELSSGFLYAVSSSSTTGHKSGTMDERYLERLRNSGFRNPVLVGFGIKDNAGFSHVCRFVNGAIIGSAFIKSIGNEQTVESSVKQFLKGVLGR